MALRLRKDVQKASYYVWFLGAQEAKGLRGDNILYPAIPRLVERCREQEPLKVTLQVSHKGLKIIQGSSKHFIPHGAITCSVQTEDIVACVLLLYNPATKCPLHVHAYRLDSETTALALNDQLQVLINRSENQKRFNELEARLGVPDEVTLPPPKPIPERQASSRRFESQLRRFDSSLGSDTGTSTRESECSDENSPSGPLSPVIPSGLFDSLAAELRAKLNGNGPPLLLPPRDYDTVHRSKGNLAAIELRRCQNTCIVGGIRPSSVKQLISSRGSSGIGSDLAPSPERHEGPSSSDEDWTNDRSNAIVVSQQTKSSKPIARRPSKAQDDYLIKQQKSPPAAIQHSKYRDQQPQKQQSEQQTEPVRSSYIYPRRVKESALDENRYYRSSSREESGSSKEEEEDVKPIVTKSAPLESRFRQVFDYEGINAGRNKSSPASSLEEKRHHANDGSRRPQNSSPQHQEDYKRYEKKPPVKSGKPRDSYEAEQIMYRENLTDRQKFREISEKQRYPSEDSQSPRRYNMYRDEAPEPQQKYQDHSQERSKPSRSSKYIDSTDGEFYKSETDKNLRHRHSDGRRSRGDDGPTKVVEVSDRNPYREADSMPYRESIEKMLKSPVMRYKSLDDNNYGRDVEVVDDRWVQNNQRYRQPAVQKEKSRDVSPPPAYRDEPVPRYRDDIARYPSRRWENQMRYEPQMAQPSTESTMKRVSPKDRFENAKEKFQAMEREKQRDREQLKVMKKTSEVPRRGSMEQQQHAPLSRRQYPSHNEPQNWSSEEDIANMHVASPRGGGYREMPNQDRFPGLDRETAAAMSPQRMMNAKSLGNLVKGYRHSYAEPQSQFPRNSGRVGLAAVNPF